MKGQPSNLWVVAIVLLVAGFSWAVDPPVEGGDGAGFASEMVLKEGTEDLLETSFESVFPRLPWRVSHPEDAADVDWGRTDYRASEGRYSIYCAGMGPEAAPDGGPAPANTASWAIVGPYDLTETTAGTMTFKLWMTTERFQDVFMWLVSVDGQNFSGSARSTDTSGWQTISVDLANWGAAGDVIGESEIWIAFVYQSDHNTLFEGAYVDEVLLTVDLGTPGTEGTTYTTDADFAKGVMVGLESTADRLELADGWDALPYLWVPNSVTGTVSKVDAETGGELGRYATGPNQDVNPGVAAVDLEGSCWVGNRAAGTVVKIGLAENGGCVDRDGDGEIDTSSDQNGDGDISGSELLAWGSDECVVVETVLVNGLEGTHVPGEEHDDYAENNLQAVAVDATGSIWVGVYDSNFLYLLDGTSGEVLDQVDLADDATYPTAAVVDGDGTLWVSSWPDQWVLSYTPGTGDTEQLQLPHGSAGLTLNRDNDLFVTGFAHEQFTKVDTETKAVEWTQLAGSLANGVATSANGRIWIAAPGVGTVSRYSPAGVLTQWETLPGRPTGIALDQDGKVWAVGAETDAIYRIDPDFVAVDLEKVLVGSGGHDATGDLTGIVARNLTSRFGTWTVDHDNEVAGTPWGSISWEEHRPTGTAVSVRVRSSEDAEDWSAWEFAGNGIDLAATPAGRYLQIQVSLQFVSGEELPNVTELTVTPASTQTPPDASFTWTPQSPTVGEDIQFTDTSSGEPDSWSWDFGDDSSSDLQNPSHTYASEGSFAVVLTATNGAGSNTHTQTFNIGSGGCNLTCDASAPMTADLDEPASFGSQAAASACTGTIAYAWSFGDGATSDEQNPTHTFSTTGTLRWGMTASIDDASCSRAGDITVSGAGPDECTLSYWVPVVSRADGANGSIWRTDLGLLGNGSSETAVELRLHTPGSTTNRVVTVAPSAMVNLVDVVSWLDGDLRGSWPMEICADGEISVDSRTYNVLAPDHACFPDGTFGQYLAGDSSGDGLSSRESATLGQLRETEDFRTNIGLVNTGTAVATVVIDLIDAAGTQLESFTLEIQPGQWHQENRPFFRRAGVENLDAASALVSVVTGAGVVVYGSVIDNRTNDATTIPMRR